MNKQDLINMLGMKFSKLIKHYHFPNLQENMVSPQDLDYLNNLFDLKSKEQQKAFERLTKILLQGTIDEVKWVGKSLLLKMTVVYREEKYQVELALEQGRWVYQTIYYSGQIEKESKTTFSLVLLLAVFLIVITSGTWLYITKNNSWQELIASFSVQNQEGTEEQPALETIPLDTLQEAAKSYEQVLISQTEYEKLKEIEENLLNNINVPSEVEQSSTMEEETVVEEVPTQEITVVIRPGMTAYEVAVLLAENGVTEDREEFFQYLIQEKLQSRLRAGTHRIPVPIAKEEIIYYITSKRR